MYLEDVPTVGNLASVRAIVIAKKGTEMTYNRLAEEAAYFGAKADGNAERDEEVEDLRAELEAARAEIERLKTVPMKYRRMAFNAQLQDENAKLNQQLADEQAKNVGLREALENHSGNYKLSKEECTKINALLDAPSDTSALEAIVKKAGEVMREECITAAGPEDSYQDDWIRAKIDACDAIRDLPAVTLEDLK